MKLTTVLTAAAVALTALTADAALITWGAAQDITADSDVNTTGTFLGAVALGATPGSPTINGVNFTGVFPSGSVGPFSFSGFDTASSTLPSGSAPHSLLSSPYADLLRSVATGTSPSLTLSGLAVGNTYLVQFWADSAGFPTTSSSTLTAGNSVTLDPNTTNVGGGIGQYVLGTFVADATTQAISMNGFFNGVQLRALPAAPAVPEPGTALAGLTLLGLLSVRRRRAA